jgi:hypothetical protein
MGYFRGCSEWDGGTIKSPEMTDQYTSLSPAALKDIITHIDQSLAILARHLDGLSATELQIKKMLMALRARLVDRLENHPDAEG